MNRRNFIKAAALASIVPASAPANLLAAPKISTTEPEVALVTTPPVLQNLSGTGATVFWSVNRPATGWVEFGETPALGRVARGEVDGLRPFDPRVLRVRLAELHPGRKYFYRVQTVPIASKGAYDLRRLPVSTGAVYSFTTFDPAALSASFTVWNDTHEQGPTLLKLVQQLHRHSADFHVWNGDLVNSVRSEDTMVRQVLSPAGSAYATDRPVVIVRGNHDTRGASARLLQRVVEGPGNRYYYTFRQGPLAVLVLDTGEDKDDDNVAYGGLGDFASYRLEQQRWLEQAIAQPEFAAAPFRILFTHIPLRGHACSADSAEKWQALLARARIDFAISGHTHTYAYHEPTPEQPFPLLVGGGPDLKRATFIYGRASSEQLEIGALSINGPELGRWKVARG